MKAYSTVLAAFSEFTFEEVVEYVNTVRESITGLLDFITSLPDAIITLFPFMTASQVAYVVFLLVVSMVISCYFFFKKVV